MRSTLRCRRLSSEITWMSDHYLQLLRQHFNQQEKKENEQLPLIAFSFNKREATDNPKRMSHKENMLTIYIYIYYIAYRNAVKSCRGTEGHTAGNTGQGFSNGGGGGPVSKTKISLCTAKQSSDIMACTSLAKKMAFNERSSYQVSLQTCSYRIKNLVVNIQVFDYYID